MRSRVSIMAVLLAALVAGPWSAKAQTPQVQQGSDSVSSTHVPGIDIPPLPNAPFTGTDKIVWIRPTGNGGSVTVSLEAKAARDSQGRLYREEHCFCPAGTDPLKTLREFTISDPVTHLRINCVKGSRWCHVTRYEPNIAAIVEHKIPAPGPLLNGREYLTRENLGTKNIDGLSAVGTLETLTVSPGVMGNDQPLTLTRELWYSPDLKNNLAATRKDPRDGTQIVTLAVLSRDEPDPNIFNVPAEYGIVDERGVVVRQPQPQPRPTQPPATPSIP